MKITFTLLTLILTTLVAVAQQPITGTTEDGRKFLLYPDGTWRLVKEPSGASNSTNTPRSSSEGVAEHTYELIQDYTIQLGGGQAGIRLRRGERYRGRILADHAEIDIRGISYPIPRSILYAQPRD